MQTQVHNKSFVIDQWTGESIDSNKKFKIPQKGLKVWKGCYGTPSTGLAGLTYYITRNPNISKDESDELFGVYQSSLVKCDPEEKYPHFTINSAPPFTLLTGFGGKTSLETYHNIYGHDIQREIYSQIINSDVDMGVSSSPPQPPAKSDSGVMWNVMNMNIRYDYVDDEPVMKSAMPRCAGSWFEFLRSQTGTDTPHALVIYFHPKNDKIFAIGKPNDWNVSLNKKAGNLFNKLPVFGDVTVVSKEEFNYSPLAKKKAKLEIKN
jgi:hypothetical protein